VIWLTEAMKSQVVALAIVRAKSLARRRLRFNQAMVRSTTQRRSSNLKPFAVADRLMISSVQLPMLASASRSFLPA